MVPVCRVACFSRSLHWHGPKFFRVSGQAKPKALKKNLNHPKPLLEGAGDLVSWL